MAKLKEKILQSLKNGKHFESTLNALSRSQENLLKNHSNPVFSNKDRGKILRGYVSLQEIDKSLYRYKTLQEYNYQNDAQEEKENIEDKVLQTGISYYKYVWHAENSKHTCDKCRELDGQVFDFYDEVPQRPHPNCKCWVEVVENIDTKVENDDNTNKIPPQNTNPQHEQKPTQPKTTSLPSIPQQPTKTMPVSGPITSPHGWRIHPTYGTKKFHDGVDIGVPINTPVKAVASGRIVMAQWFNGYGKYIKIDHGNNIHSFYGHLNSFDVKVGDYVNSGQIIAKSGNTAGIGKNGKIMTTGPHLHFGIHINGQSINPLDFVRNF